MSGVKNLNQGWGGVTVAPASVISIDPAISPAPLVRSIGNKFQRVITTAPIPVSTTVLYPWIDTLQTGATTVTVTFYASQWQAAGSNGCYLDQSDDPFIGPAAVAAGTVAVLGALQAQFGSFVCNVTRRYWRVRYINGSVVPNPFEITTMESSVPAAPTIAPTQGAQALAGTLITDNFNNANFGPFAPAWASSPGVFIGAIGAGTNMIRTSGGLYSFQRSPDFLRGGQFGEGGPNIIWNPGLGKKFRLMKYKIEAGEDVSISGGPTAVNLMFRTQKAIANSGLGITSGASFGYTHRFVAPAAVLATSGSLYDSGWIDLGNGQTTANANDLLVAGICIPQSTSAVNPQWTLTSNQWEAGTVGFKTIGTRGYFKLVQQAATTSGSSTAANSFAYPTATGNSIFVFISTTNVVGGAPTIAVTDTAGNTYTVTSKITNASDGSFGTSLCMAYCVNATANAANVVTVTTSVNVPSLTRTCAMEYSGVGAGGIDATQVGTTGNSTTAASGNYTPATAGDLIFTYMSSTTQIVNPLPTLGGNFMANFTLSNANGTLCIGDNFGNGVLTTGAINCIAIGMEE